jgi:hypothetical protein
LALYACNKRDTPDQTVVVTPPAANTTVEASPAEPVEGPPPPEQYATLPPGAFEDAEHPGVDGTAEPTPGDIASGSATGVPAKPDRGLVPNAGELALTGVRLGMTAPEIHGRYPADSGWSYDQRFIAGTETGVILAKPNDANARATEMTMVQDGVAVAFLRAVREDNEVFRTSVGELSGSFGTPKTSPPDWARQFKLFAGWHSSANEQSRFWMNQEKRQLLTAGHSPTGAETVYMLMDLPRMQAVQTAMEAAKLGMPDEAPPVDPGWAPPPGIEVN